MNPSNPEYFEWKSEYNVGLQDIDSQHQNLVDFINRLAEVAPLDGAAALAVAEEVMMELIDYTNYHFSAEESLMEKEGYPAFEAHQAEHGQLILRVQRMAYDFRTQKTGLNELLSFLKEWLIHHIQKSDLAIVTFIESKST